MYMPHRKVQNKTKKKKKTNNQKKKKDDYEPNKFTLLRITPSQQVPHATSSRQD